MHFEFHHLISVLLGCPLSWFFLAGLFNSSSTTALNQDQQQIGIGGSAGNVFGGVVTHGGTAVSNKPVAAPRGTNRTGSILRGPQVNGPGTGGGTNSTAPGGNNSPSVNGSGNVQEIATTTNTTTDPEAFAAITQIAHDAITNNAALAAESVGIGAQGEVGNGIGSSVGTALGDIFNPSELGGSDNSGGTGSSNLFLWLSVAGLVVGVLILMRD